MAVLENKGPLVITLHGIRTRGKWQRDLVPLLEAAKCRCQLPDYGWFWAWQLARKASRERKIKWFLEEYTRITQNEAGPPHIIAHSMGTYIVAAVMERYPQVKFDRMVFCGSIVGKSYSWSDRHSNGQFNHLLNECGGRDIWVRAAEYVVEDAGPSGCTGFEDLANSNVTQEINPWFAHSDYWYELNYSDRWIPFLKGTIPAAIPRTKQWRVNIKFWLVRSLVAILFVATSYYLIAMAARSDLPWDEPPGPLGKPRLTAESIGITRAEALAPSNNPASDIRLSVHNDTSRNLAVVLYPCEEFFAPDPQNKNSFIQLFIKAGKVELVQDLEYDHGWYLVYAKSKADPGPVFVRRVNLLDQKMAHWHIKTGGDSEYSIVPE